MKNLEITFLILTMIAEIIGTIGGFGSSVFFVPMASIYFDFQTVLGITAVFHVASNLSKIALFKKDLDKLLIFYLGIPAVIFVIIGGFISKYIQVHLLELVLGIFLICLSLLFLINTNLTIGKGKKQAIVGGTLSGLTAGILGTGGAIRGITMAAFNLEKGVFVATSAFIDFGVDASRTVVYYYNGYIQKEVLIYIPFLIAIAYVGSLIGKKILEHIPQESFRKLTLILILLIGIFTIYKL